MPEHRKQNLHVLMRKEDLDVERAADKVLVVLDVLFATSTIVTAFEHGATDVVPALDADAAREAAHGLAEGSFLLAGERHLEPIPGFATYAPLGLSRENLTGRRLIYSTTNGTVALARARTARAVYAAALLNGRAVAEHIASHHDRETVLLVCAGADGGFNIEDFFGAGYLVHCLQSAEPGRWAASDAAVAARELYRARAEHAAACLLESRLGRIVSDIGQAAEVEFAARTGIYRSVPILRDERLVQAAAGAAR